jgi:hypothetical protein
MINDLRFAFRMLIKYPAFSVVAFLALVLGIGANTTVFGIINALLLRPLPVGHSEEVVKVFTTDNHIPGNQSTSYLNFQDYARQNTAFSSMAAYGFTGMGMTRGSDTLNVGALFVSGNYFDLLRVKSRLGRTFLPDEDTTPNGHPVAVLGHSFWEKLGADPQLSAVNHIKRTFLHRDRSGAGGFAPGRRRLSPIFRCRSQCINGSRPGAPTPGSKCAVRCCREHHCAAQARGDHVKLRRNACTVIAETARAGLS